MRGLRFSLLVCGLLTVATAASGQVASPGVTIKSSKTKTQPMGAKATLPPPPTGPGTTHTIQGWNNAVSGQYDTGIGPAAGTNYRVRVLMVDVVGGAATPTSPQPTPSMNGYTSDTFSVNATGPNSPTSWDTKVAQTPPAPPVALLMGYTVNTPPFPGEVPRNIQAALQVQTGFWGNWSDMAGVYAYTAP